MKNMALNYYIKKTSLSIVISAMFSLPFYVSAADTNATEVKAESINDAWQFANLIENDQGDYLKLSGRLQLDSTWIDSDQGDFNDTLWRRFRFGFKGKVW